MRAQHSILRRARTVDGHGFPHFLARRALDDIVAHVLAHCERFEGRRELALEVVGAETIQGDEYGGRIESVSTVGPPLRESCIGLDCSVLGRAIGPVEEADEQRCNGRRDDEQFQAPHASIWPPPRRSFVERSKVNDARSGTAVAAA